MDAQSAGVVERGAALVILPGQQGLHAVVLKGWMHQGQYCLIVFEMLLRRVDANLSSLAGHI